MLEKCSFHKIAQLVAGFFFAQIVLLPVLTERMGVCVCAEYRINMVINDVFVQRKLNCIILITSCVCVDVHQDKQNQIMNPFW